MANLEEQAMPPRWNEEEYLTNYPDIAASVASGRFKSGYQHFCEYGILENRNGTWRLDNSVRTTRACLDPWNYVEITPDLGVKPCCRMQPLAKLNKDSLNMGRNSPGFMALRKELASGELRNICKRCHIRPLVPVWFFRKMLNKQERPLQPHKIKSLRIEITTRCNLRCVYCPVSFPNYVGKDMPVDAIEPILKLVDNTDDKAEILLNGHGETTYHPHWMDFCRPILARPNKVMTMITNLARPLQDDEVECMAGLGAIQVSMDTADPELLAALRRKVKLSTITDNIARIRAASKRRGWPRFTLSAGVYDRSVDGLTDLARFAIEQGIVWVTFWSLVKYDDIPGAINVYPVSSLPVEKIRHAVKMLEETRRILLGANIGVEIAGGFLDEWRQRCDG